MTTESFFRHPLALVESDEIGARTRIWAWAHVMKGARLGADCNVGEHCFIESGVVLGDRVTVKNGVALWEGLVVGNDVFFGPNAVLTNDLRPRSRVYHDHPVPTRILEGVSIGANATVLCGITLGRHALIGAGSVVLRDVPDHGLVVGNPGRLRGYVCRCAEPLRFEESLARCACGRAYRKGATVEESTAP